MPRLLVSLSPSHTIVESCGVFPRGAGPVTTCTSWHARHKVGCTTCERARSFVVRPRPLFPASIENPFLRASLSSFTFPSDLISAKGGGSIELRDLCDPGRIQAGSKESRHVRRGRSSLSDLIVATRLMPGNSDANAK